MATEYRLVATCPDGRLKKWPKRNLNRSIKALADLRKDIAERGATYSEPYIETREVGEWSPTESLF